MAEPGLYIWNADGDLRLGPNTSNVTILGAFNTGKSNGSISNPVLARGRGVIIAALPLAAGWSPVPPKLTVSGTTISWTFRISGSNGNADHRVIYGVRA
mgnify:CR=1 FL=1